MKFEWKKLNRKTYTLLVILTALLFVTVFATGIFAKYVVNMQGAGTIGAAKFYFESDELSTENPEHTLIPTTTSVTFSLKNYKDEINFSGMDIDYTVQVSAKETKTGNATTAPTISQSSGTLNKNEKSEAEITLSNLQGGTTYAVTVQGDGGYKKTLQATFVILEKDLGLYMNVKDGDRVALTVLVSEVSGDVSITVPSDLTLDKASDPALDGVTVTDSKFNYALAQKHSKTFYFLKDDPSEAYDAEDFTVMMNGEKATVVDIID